MFFEHFEVSVIARAKKKPLFVTCNVSRVIAFLSVFAEKPMKRVLYNLVSSVHFIPEERVIHWVRSWYQYWFAVMLFFTDQVHED